MGLFVAYFYGSIIDSIKGDIVSTKLWWYVGGLAMVISIHRLSEWLIARCHIDRIDFDMDQHFSTVTLSRISKFSMGQIINQNSGFKQDVVKKGEMAIAELVNTLFRELAPAIVRMFASVIALCFMSVIVGGITTLSVAAFITASVYINQRMLPAIKKHRKLESRLGTKYWEWIKHLRLVTVSNQEARMISDFSSDYEHFSRVGKGIWLPYIRMVTFLREPCAVLGQVSSLVAGVYLVREDVLTLGQLVICIGWTSNAFGALSTIGSMQRRIVRNSVHIGKYFDLLEMQPAITVVQNPIRPPRFQGMVEFKDVRFSYPRFQNEKDDDDDEVSTEGEHAPALRGVSFSIRSGTVCALVGHSGSGKSTAINLLMRGYDPDGGQILVDGHDLRLLDLGYWRQSVGIVEQDPKLWDDTLRYNILYGLNDHADKVTEAELEDLARKTRIDEFYERLGPQRFNVIIGENGVQLSGGQRQRVAIARAIVKHPSLLILDEATNALDVVNEQLVHEAIKEALVGRTGIIIAHRLSTIRSADQIVVFDKGIIAGIGSHADLMKECKVYQGLVKRELDSLTV